MENLKQETYYAEVASYYDEDARDFEQRYEENPVLQKIRTSFRKQTERYPFSHALEIGCGPGFDVCHFAARYPDRMVYAIDVSPEMVRLTRENASSMGLENVRVETGSVEDVHLLFPGLRFDLVYVYFGGLNTVFDLEAAAGEIASFCSEDANLVLTFVNRFYVTEIPLWLARGRFHKAFERILEKWRGYSDVRKIPSRVLSQGDIKRAFGSHFTITSRRGYSIFYPAWYRSHLLPGLGSMAEKLWKLDRLISRTPLWNTGEYSLYAMQPSGPSQKPG
ncbi:class I SAM-dependent methyltransferase [Balneolales bacterium ANBcel1]|nr:class I SAM-dependent methyltransferase [Balneolales bacterium ANBcel1]